MGNTSRSRRGREGAAQVSPLNDAMAKLTSLLGDERGKPHMLHSSHNYRSAHAGGDPGAACIAARSTCDLAHWMQSAGTAFAPGMICKNGSRRYRPTGHALRAGRRGEVREPRPGRQLAKWSTLRIRGCATACAPTSAANCRRRNTFWPGPMNSKRSDLCTAQEGDHECARRRPRPSRAGG